MLLSDPSDHFPEIKEKVEENGPCHAAVTQSRYLWDNNSVRFTFSIFTWG